MQRKEKRWARDHQHQDQNEALLIKHLHKFFNRVDIPWVSLIWEKYYSNDKLPGVSNKGSFWWKDCLKLLGKFKRMGHVEIASGTSCLAWEDLWTDQALSQKFPELLSFAKNRHITFAQMHATSQLHSLFHLPLSQQAHDQLQSLQLLRLEANNSDQNDRWSYIWHSGAFSVKKAYSNLSGHIIIHQAYSWLWESSCQSKHKVFFWLVLKDRISTRELLRRKRMHLQSYSCVLCNASVDETLSHLLLECPFANQCWNIVNVQINANLSPYQLLTSFRDQLHVPFFMEIIVLMAWTIRKSRNDLIFRGINPSIQQAKLNFKEEWRTLLFRAKRRYYPTIEQWTAGLI